MTVTSHVGDVIGEQGVDDVHTSILRGAGDTSKGYAMEHAHEVREELREPAKELRALIPDVMRGYAELSRAALAPGELPLSTKSLLALVIAVTRECDGCIVAHSRSCAREGVSRQAVAEALGVAIMMNGGPATAWGPRALRSFDEAIEEFRS